MAQKIKAAFLEPMLLLRSNELPDDEEWLHEIKLDGYRALAIKTGGQLQLRSRNDNDFTERVSLAPAGDGSAIRIPGMDGRKPSPAHKVRGAPG